MIQNTKLNMRELGNEKIGNLKKINDKEKELRKMKKIQDNLSESLQMKNYWNTQKEINKSLFKND